MGFIANYIGLSTRCTTRCNGRIFPDNSDVLGQCNIRNGRMSDGLQQRGKLVQGPVGDCT